MDSYYGTYYQDHDGREIDNADEGNGFEQAHQAALYSFIGNGTDYPPRSAARLRAIDHSEGYIASDLERHDHPAERNDQPSTYPAEPLDAEQQLLPRVPYFVDQSRRFGPDNLVPTLDITAALTPHTEDTNSYQTYPWDQFFDFDFDGAGNLPIQLDLEAGANATTEQRRAHGASDLQHDSVGHAQVAAIHVDVDREKVHRQVLGAAADGDRVTTIFHGPPQGQGQQPSSQRRRLMDLASTARGASHTQLTVGIDPESSGTVRYMNSQYEAHPADSSRSSHLARPDMPDGNLMEVPSGRGTPRSRRSAKRSFSEHEQSNQIAEGVALADEYQSSLQTDDTTAIVVGSNVIGLAAPESVEFLLCDHPGCGKRLEGKSGLRKHRQHVHRQEGTKPHACPFCSRGFEWRKDVARHIASMHIETVECFRCPLCARVFLDKDECAVHVRRICFKELPMSS